MVQASCSHNPAAPGRGTASAKPGRLTLGGDLRVLSKLGHGSQVRAWPLPAHSAHQHCQLSSEWSTCGSLPKPEMKACGKRGTSPSASGRFRVGMQPLLGGFQNVWGGHRNARGGGDGGVVRMLGFRAFLCHICGAQNPGCEWPCAHVLAVLSKAGHKTFLSLVSSSVKRKYFYLLSRVVRITSI